MVDSLRETELMPGSALKRAQKDSGSEIAAALSSFDNFVRFLFQPSFEEDELAPNETAMNGAWKFLATFGKRLTPTAIVRSPEGGVAICFTGHDHYADCEFFNDGDVLGVTSKGCGDAKVFDVDPSCKKGVDDAIARISECLKSPEETVPSRPGAQ